MSKYYFCAILALLYVSNADGQVLQFGTCPEIKTMEYFDLERFLGQWYEVARYPTWYEDYGACAYKRIQYCGRRIEIEHVFVRDGIQYVLHVNSTYTPGDEAVFAIQMNNIDPIGIPLNVIATDYENYAVVFGCKNNTETDLKYMSAWILSREPTLPHEILLKSYSELNAVPSANVVFLQTVEQRPDYCRFYWTAHVQAVDTVSDDII